MQNNFSQALLDWYDKNKRDLSWRNENSPYHVLVSEIMLQQTQVPRVMEKYPEFLTLFPTIQDLAKATTADVIKAWSGLGYNRRALLLHQFAQQVCVKLEGKIPSSSEELQKLPGIGPYTAGSIAAFAFNISEPAIDVNVRRIFLRYFAGKDQGLPMNRKEEKKLHELVKKNIPEGKSADFHNGLMDFGSLFCLRDAPKCTLCPLSTSCAFYPLYTVKKEKILFVAEKKTEKGITENGKFIPNRIFRGRIVEFTRRNSGNALAITDFGKQIKEDYREAEEKWLLRLCEKLKKERFLQSEIKGKEIRLWLG